MRLAGYWCRARPRGTHCVAFYRGTWAAAFSLLACDCATWHLYLFLSFLRVLVGSKEVAGKRFGIFSARPPAVAVLAFSCFIHVGSVVFFLRFILEVKAQRFG